jgi:hypothetical protein
MTYLYFLFIDRDSQEEFVVMVKADIEQQPNLQPYATQAKEKANEFFNNPRYRGLVDDDYAQQYGIDVY